MGCKQIQAKLPDVNAVLVYYRTQSQKLMSQANWLGAEGALNAQNAVLPEDYRVIIDTKEYHKAVQTGIFYVCLGCSAEVPVQEIKFVQLLNNSLEQTHYNEKYSEFWIHDIPGCGHKNRKIKSEKITEKKQEPFYLNCVWEPPIKKAGLSTRFGFRNKFMEWFYTYQKELEHQIGRYRAEYQAQNPDDDMDEWEDDGLK